MGEYGSKRWSRTGEPSLSPDLIFLLKRLTFSSQEEGDGTEEQSVQKSY